MARTLGILALAVLCSGASCGKKSSANPDEYDDISNTFDDSEPKPDDRKPVDGVDLSKLDPTQKQRFERLVDRLISPCGKAHSLRTSKNNDPDCKRAPFAVEYVVMLLADGFSNAEIREIYNLRYKQDSARGFKLDGAPHSGPDDARVVLVEFYDYGCPACAEFKLTLEEAGGAFPQDAVVYYKMFPLAAHEHSPGAAQAALAAHAQGKFKQMHDLLFKNQFKHQKDDLWAHARAIGLDMNRFETDFKTAEAVVNADKAEGTEAGVSGTPTLYVNGRKYDGILHPKYLKMWIEEELALE